MNVSRENIGGFDFQTVREIFSLSCFRTVPRRRWIFSRNNNISCADTRVIELYLHYKVSHHPTYMKHKRQYFIAQTLFTGRIYSAIRSRKPEIVVTCARVAVSRSFDTVTGFVFRLSLQSDLSKNVLANHCSAVRPLAANCVRAR